MEGLCMYYNIAEIEQAKYKPDYLTYMENGVYYHLFNKDWFNWRDNKYLLNTEWGWHSFFVTYKRNVPDYYYVFIIKNISSLPYKKQLTFYGVKNRTSFNREADNHYVFMECIYNAWHMRSNIPLRYVKLHAIEHVKEVTKNNAY